MPWLKNLRLKWWPLLVWRRLPWLVSHALIVVPPLIALDMIKISLVLPRLTSESSCLFIIFFLQLRAHVSWVPDLSIYSARAGCKLHTFIFGNHHYHLCKLRQLSFYLRSVRLFHILGCIHIPFFILTRMFRNFCHVFNEIADFGWGFIGQRPST